jgi:hypothetical protein
MHPPHLNSSLAYPYINSYEVTDRIGQSNATASGDMEAGDEAGAQPHALSFLSPELSRPFKRTVRTCGQISTVCCGVFVLGIHHQAEPHYKGKSFVMPGPEACPLICTPPSVNRVILIPGPGPEPGTNSAAP